MIDVKLVTNYLSIESDPPKLRIKFTKIQKSYLCRMAKNAENIHFLNHRMKKKTLIGYMNIQLDFKYALKNKCV